MIYLHDHTVSLSGLDWVDNCHHEHIAVINGEDILCARLGMSKRDMALTL